jgi:hypothetical protein
MGYGEFGGGGSVNWTVAQGGSPGHNAQVDPGNPKRAGGNDDGVAANARFTVYVNGVQVADADIATSRIVVVWPGQPQPPNTVQNVPMEPDGNIGHVAKGGGAAA